MDYLIDFILFGLIYLLFFYRRWRRKKKLIGHTIMYIYIVMVMYVTIMPITLPFGGTNNLFMESANFTPFRDVMMNYGGAVRGIILNVIMMVPFGFLLPIVKRRGFFGTVISTFLFSLSIECFQLVNVWLGGLNQRIFDVTDLITNTFGGFLGYLIYLVFRPIVNKIIRK